MKTSIVALACNVAASVRRLMTPMMDRSGSSLWRLVGVTLLGVIVCRLFGFGISKWTLLLSLLSGLSLTTDFLQYVYVFIVTLPRDLR